MSQVDAEFDIIVATTKLVSGKTFMQDVQGHPFPVPNPNERRPPVSDVPFFCSGVNALFHSITAHEG